jgi:hypothetical protein
MLAGENNKVLEAFFLDRQSNSFSLSKFQVIAWTTVAVFGYLYLYLCRTYIQWTFSFPPIPDGLPTLLGVSAGTTVTATAITVNRGSKGAGPMSPSMADFVSTGGLVAGERFQFFVWTLIGCLGFLGIVLSSDPASLTQLPDIQGTFLTLMGVSATGYLAGKLVRQPGPIIDLLTLKEPATPAVPATATTPMHPGIMKIKVKGQNLSDTAVVKVDQTELRIDQFTLTGTTKQDQPAGSSFYSELELDLLDAEAYRKGTHLIYLVNGDGQAACEAFPMNALTIDPVPAIKAGSAPVTVHLTGRNIAAGLVAGWVDAGHNTSPIPSTDIAFVDGNHFDVKLVPGPTQGTGALTLTTPSNLIVEAAIQIS